MKTLTIQLTMPPRFRLIDGEAHTLADVHAGEARAAAAVLANCVDLRATMDTLAAHRARSASARLGWQTRRAAKV